jgi:hypothetical protein
VRNENRRLFPEGGKSLRYQLILEKPPPLGITELRIVDGTKQPARTKSVLRSVDLADVKTMAQFEQYIQETHILSSGDYMAGFRMFCRGFASPELPAQTPGVLHSMS